MVHPPSPGQVGCRGRCYFHDKAEKYERNNEIHVIVMICHTVSEYHKHRLTKYCQSADFAVFHERTT